MLWPILMIWMALGLFPVVSAMPETPFPDITFRIFSEFVDQHFSSTVSLSTVLLVLFSLTENPELLNLHARQQNPVFQGERNIVISGWIKVLARALGERLDTSISKLFQKPENQSQMSVDATHNALGIKLDAFAKVLQLYPYNQQGRFQGKLQTISHDAIKPVHVICPDAMECETMDCNPRSLLQATKWNDVPSVTLIRGTTVHDNAYVLTGKCPGCQTIYHADHERAKQNGEQDRWNRVYLNSAKYLKVGRNTWVDRVFSKAVLNGMYSFHASVSAYAEFWNNTYSPGQNILTRRQIWHTFIQESIRTIAAISDINLEIQDGLSIDEVTKEAFNVLGEDGVIRAAGHHSCSECTQPYKQTADIITGDDPAALVGVDDNREVPVLVGDGADLAVQDAAQAREHALNSEQAHHVMDVDHAPVTMAVLDGIVMGPQVGTSNLRL
jgi:CxC5 like cysteine cluster associated with KDZ transposases